MMSVRVAVVSHDEVFGTRLLDGLRLDRSCLGVGFRSSAAARLALRSTAPHVVVIDCGMAGALGLCADLSLARETGVVMVAVPEDGDTAVEALSAGARGIVFTTQPVADVVKAVHVVHKGQMWAPRHVVAATWMRFKADTVLQQRIGEPEFFDRLSGRERQVFQQAATGVGNKELATRLSISEATVKVHLTHIFRKLGLRGRGELAAAFFGIIR